MRLERVQNFSLVRNIFRDLANTPRRACVLLPEGVDLSMLGRHVIFLMINTVIRHEFCMLSIMLYVL